MRDIQLIVVAIMAVVVLANVVGSKDELTEGDVFYVLSVDGPFAPGDQVGVNKTKGVIFGKGQDLLPMVLLRDLDGQVMCCKSVMIGHMLAPAPTNFPASPKEEEYYRSFFPDEASSFWET